ncbi:hypothetical protein FHS29_000777 [Saccharothrix tamanrassetensis]|uniref:DUF5753 domain-containing protein n=1 Tax=Saccharothrix tamanrassetensis TaxID=1051531 RepID=A0A841CDG4_9PSEU|nr:DUF5753 domain-containing protein [Saccharothrix tamanrassetensis]MBB5954207.1 hypothetical protein [Saccharothrix tamanrassetensis]
MKDIRLGRLSQVDGVRRGIDLIDLVRLAHYDHVDPDGPEALRAAERRATEIVSYDTLAVPALLQTPEYAAVLGTDPDRRDVLRRHLPPACEFFVHETALHAWVGDRAVLRAQLRHLVHHGDVRLVPFTAGARAEFRHSFTLLRFAVGGPAVHTEALSERFDVVARYQEAVAVLRRCALTAEDSRSAFAARAEIVR